MARKFLTPIDLARNELQNATVQNLASAPATPIKGLEYFDTTLNQLGIYNGTSWSYMGSGGGTVTSASVVTANGFAGTVANATTTPAITLTTSVTGVLKGNGTAVSAATAGTDYVVPSGNITGTAANVTGTVAIANGGTGSTTQNFVDLTTAQTIAGVKTFNASPSVPAPTNATDAANKQYVDTSAQGLSAKASVVALGSSNLTLSAAQTIDGIAVAAGQRVLLTGQTTASQNGIWVVQTGAWTRPTDFATNANVVGTYVFVESGTANANSGWVVQGNTAITVDTTAETWVQFTGAGEVVAGTGLSKTGNTLNISTVPVANGGTGATSVAGAKTSFGFVGRFTATIGDGTTTAIAVTHSLGTQDVIAQIRDASSNAVVDCDITQTSTTVTTFTFGTAPAANAYKVVIVG